MEGDKAPVVSDERMHSPAREPQHSSVPTQDTDIPLIGETSPGVRRIEALSRHITTLDRVFIFLSVFLVAYVYGLDNTLRYTYQPYATASYSEHSLLATIGVLRSVIAAAAQPTAAKIADVFGRVEIICASVVFYVVGTIVEALSDSVQTFSAGAVLFQIGFTCIVLLVEVIIADITSSRARLLFSYIPAAPFLINTWVSGNVAEAVLATTTWNWGIGMWGIIYPVCAMPLIVSIQLVHRRAKRHGDVQQFRTPYQILGLKRLIIAIFWQLDLIGIFLLVAVFALLLVPFTVAGGVSATWGTGQIIAPLVIGILLLPVFVYWESKAPHPMLPFKLLKDRAVWGALGIAVMLNFAWYLQGNYLYTVLVVAFDMSVTAATRVASLYSFSSVLVGLFVGLVVFFVRRLKPFVIAGTALFMVSYGLLLRYRGGLGPSNNAGVIGAQVLLGIAGGLFPYTAQASIQVATRHEHLAVVTGLFLAAYNIGSALGNTVSGAVWSNTLPNQLRVRLAPVTNNATLADAAFADPFTFATEYPFDTAERIVVVEAYKHTMKLLCITGICLCVPLIAFALVIRNPRLTNHQSLPEAEKWNGDAVEMVTPSEEDKSSNGAATEANKSLKGLKGWKGLMSLKGLKA